MFFRKLKKSSFLFSLGLSSLCFSQVPDTSESSQGSVTLEAPVFGGTEGAGVYRESRSGSFLTDEQILENLPFAEDLRNELSTLLDRSRAVTPSDSYKMLKDGVVDILERSKKLRNQFILLESLRRGLVLVEYLEFYLPNSDFLFGMGRKKMDELKVDMLSSFLILGLKYFHEEMSYWQKLAETGSAPTDLNLPLSHWGLEMAELTMSFAETEVFFHAKAQYDFVIFALGYLELDLYEDTPNRQSLTPIIHQLHKLLKNIPRRAVENNKVVVEDPQAIGLVVKAIEEFNSAKGRLLGRRNKENRFFDGLDLSWKSKVSVGLAFKDFKNNKYYRQLSPSVVTEVKEIKKTLRKIEVQITEYCKGDLSLCSEEVQALVYAIFDSRIDVSLHAKLIFMGLDWKQFKLGSDYSIMFQLAGAPACVRVIGVINIAADVLEFGPFLRSKIDFKSCGEVQAEFYDSPYFKKAIHLDALIEKIVSRIASTPEEIEREELSKIILTISDGKWNRAFLGQVKESQIGKTLLNAIEKERLSYRARDILGQTLGLAQRLY